MTPNSSPARSTRTAARVWAGRLANVAPDLQVMLAMDAGEAIGFVCLIRADDPLWGGRIDNLHVAPSRRDQGVGERLLRRAASLCG